MKFLLFSIISVAGLLTPHWASAAPGEFTCATLKKGDGSDVVQQHLADTCSTSRPFSITTNKDGAPVVCCIGKQQ